MEVIASKNLDHHGVVASTISDLNLQQLIDEQLSSSPGCNVSDGEVVSAMVINSLGFTSKPLSLTPQFFANKAIDVLFRDGVKADDFNRYRLGRCLDKIHRHGCETFFAMLSQAVCQQEGINTQYQSLDTTSFTVTGDYDVERDENTIEVTHGFSKDHRSDLKQVVLELLVSQDGGVPLATKSFDGNASDSIIFKDRCKALLQHFKEANLPQYLIADSKLYSKDNAENLELIPFITRIPRTLKEERCAIDEAQSKNKWVILDDKNKYYVYHCSHYGIDQRWIVVCSLSAQLRAEKTLEKQVKKERGKLERCLKQLKNEAFKCKEDARSALDKINKSSKFHTLSSLQIIEQAHYSGQGRPKKDETPNYFTYIPEATIEEDEGKKSTVIREKSCYVIGTNIKSSQIADAGIISAYKNQNAAVERGFRFLKDPYFFASSLFVKKPARIMAMLTIMTLSLLVYSIAQRRLRQSLAESGGVVPNQINEPDEKPTLRWIFQLLEGIHVVYVKVKDKIKRVFTGIDALKEKIIRLFPAQTCKSYGFSENPRTSQEGCPM